MDDAFSLVASQMPRARWISPFGVRAIAALTLAVTLLVSFAMFVSGQQQAADARRAAMAAQQEAARRVEAQPVDRPATSLTADPSAVGDLLDQRAQRAAADALTAATQVAAAASISTEQVATATLSSMNRDLLFVNGPSTAPSIVSVFSGAAGWSAAVRGSGSTCYWVALGASGRARYGTGSQCTGMAALAADRAAW
jgi:hypothetical protein